MIRKALVAVAATTLALAISTPALAQNWKFDIGPSVGMAYYTDMLTEDHLGNNTEGINFETGWLAGLSATFWASPRFGIRAKGTYSDRPMTLGNFDVVDANDETTNIIEDINLWTGTGDLMIRFMGPSEREFVGVEFLPYLAIGAGGKWINPSGEEFAAGGQAGGNEADITGHRFRDPQSGQRFMVAEKSTLAGRVALGGDIRLAPSFALRLEFGDVMWDAPLYRLTATDALAEGDEDVGKVVHELYADLGLQFLFGLERPAVVAVAPAPPPPVERPREMPREESISVCVIDPTAPGGIKIVTATFRPTQGDTLVNGQPLRSTTGNVMIATNADWYVQGRPLTLSVGTNRVEFTTFGGSRIIEANDLAFLGTVNGVAVYADRDEVTDVMEELEEGRRATSGNDINKILEERKDLLEDLSDIGVVYVPLQTTGCVFQPLQRVEEVRKGSVK